MSIRDFFGGTGTSDSGDKRPADKPTAEDLALARMVAAARGIVTRGDGEHEKILEGVHRELTEGATPALRL